MLAELTRRNKLALLLLTLATTAAVWYGWHLFWFLTDDAFIAFRYVSNSRLGFGYVWNAPPFRPVEGYTSFLWVVLLDLIWRVTGSAPPAASNYVSLLFAYLTLLLGALMVLQMKLQLSFARHRILFLALVLVAAVTNRTFLAWTSSGLETAMFNFFLTLWVYCCLILRCDTRRWVFAVSMSAAVLTLSRPDGLLFALITLILVGAAVLRQSLPQTSRAARWKRAVPGMTSKGLRQLLSAWPLIIVPAHLFWRRYFYKAWLPNTYYAKTVAGRIWPASGLRYFLSFVLEYSYWVWLGLLLVVTVVVARDFRAHRKFDMQLLIKWAVCLALLGQFLYYTIVIGGDHFEYRVYSHLVLLAAISFLWMLNRLQLSYRRALLLFVVSIVLSWPIPWIHWAITHDLVGRPRTVVLRASVTRAIQKHFPAMPGVLLAYPRAFDSLQDWLIGHYVCMRHQEHKNFYLYLIEKFPSREKGLELSADDYPVLTEGSVGVVSWVLPRVNIIDILGLNDYVAARNPEITSYTVMAHERRPPDGYVECFIPNVSLEGGRFVINQRQVPLTAEKIRDCEARYADIVASGGSHRRVAAVQNPIDEAHFFVSQQYRDLMGREPDPPGLEYWAEHLKSCPSGSSCFNESRIKISFVLLGADEVQQTDFLSLRLNEAVLGAPPGFSDLMQDRKAFAALQVHDWRDPDDLIPAQRTFIEGWLKRAAVRALYPENLSGEEFVSRLFDKPQLKTLTEERQKALGELRAGASRAEVLRDLVESETFKRREAERSLVLLQLLLQLRRDLDYRDDRYGPWLKKLDAGERVDARHVLCLVLTSAEYQHRFGIVVTHSNDECPVVDD